MSATSFLRDRAWLDADGRHVWLEHECTNSVERTMLPNPPWHAVGDRVEPSIDCRCCGAHYFAQLNIPQPLAVEETA